MTQAQPGACIINTPGFHQKYFGTGKGFSHDWFHVFSPRLPQLFRSYALPLNTIFYCTQAGFIRAAIQNIIAELSLKKECWEDAIDLHARQFFIALYRELNPRPVETGPTSAYLDVFSRLRNIMLSHPDAPWTVAQMALQVNLSPSRFSVLYKLLYGVSPIDDLIRMRVQIAQWMLSNGSEPVARVALACGFEDPAYFNRCFKKKVGVSPGRYRKSLQDISS
jgi:AraC-like DNA-binding protein